MYFDQKEQSHENFREFTDNVMSRIVELSTECEEYWEEKKITTRLKKRIAAWREK